MDRENWSSRQIRSIDLYVESFINLRDLNWDVVESYGKWAELTDKEEEELEEEGPVKPSDVDKLDQLVFIEEIRKQLLSFADCQPEKFSKMKDYRDLINLSRSEPTNLTTRSLTKGPPLAQSNHGEDIARSHTSRSQSSIFTTKSNASVVAIEDLEKRIEIYKSKISNLLEDCKKQFIHQTQSKQTVIFNIQKVINSVEEDGKLARLPLTIFQMNGNEDHIEPVSQWRDKIQEEVEDLRTRIGIPNEEGEKSAPDPVNSGGSVE